MTDWKELCRELVTAVESNCKEHIINHDLSCAYMKADTALSQPEPEGPTDEEIADEARKYLVNEYALPAEITYFLDSDSFEYEPTIGCFRAVLARWGK